MEDTMGLSLNELLAADPSALRHSDWVELQRLARGEIAIDRDNLEKLNPPVVSRIVFRILEDDGSRWYFNQDGNWTGDASEAYVFATMDEARREMRELRSIELDEAKGARICTILTPAESRRKAAATALREFATHLRGIANVHSHVERKRALEWSAKQAESRADALWPRKGAGR